MPPVQRNPRSQYALPKAPTERSLLAGVAEFTKNFVDEIPTSEAELREKLEELANGPRTLIEDALRRNGFSDFQAEVRNGRASR